MAKINKLDLIKKFKYIHGNKFDYSLIHDGLYKTHDKVKIICKHHGIFEQAIHNHSKGRGCKFCAGNTKGNKDSFIKKSNITHNNKYDHSLVEYKNNKTNVKLICPEHGEFLVSPDNHINKKTGCPKCGNNKRSEKQKTSKKVFVKKSTLKHGDRYDYSLVKFSNNKDYIDITCPKHGVFKQRMDHHLSGHGCPTCNESKGEREISKILNEMNIEYTREFVFKKCKHKSVLKFDFFIPTINACIEFDGLQHFKPVKAWGGEDSLLEIKKRDKIKDEFCKKNNIPLLRIKYNTKKIEKEIKNFLSQL